MNTLFSLFWALVDDTADCGVNNYNDYNDYDNYNDYRDSDLDLDLDWEWFGELVTLVTQLTITDKLRNLNHDIEE